MVLRHACAVAVHHPEDIPQLESLVKEVSLQQDNLYSLTIENESGVELAQWQSNQNRARVDFRSLSRDIAYEGELFGKINMVLDISYVERQMEQRSRDLYWTSLMVERIWSH